MNYSRIAWPPGRPWLAWALLGVPALAGHAQAQNANTGTAFNTGSLYQAAAFSNTSTGSFANTGSAAVVYYAGPSAATFTNDGAYVGSAAATDQFIGPGGSAGSQTLAGSTAPTFYTLNLANGSGALFSVTNPAGANVANQLALNNGITTTTGPTVPTATLNNVAGAIRLASAATVGGSTLSPTRYVDGFVGKAGTAAFSYPLGATNQPGNGGNTTAVGTSIYSPIVLSSPGGTAIRYVAANTPNYTTFATQAGGLQLTNVSGREYYPIGTVGAATSSTITIPYNNFGPTAGGTPYVGDPTTLTIAGYDGARWTNLSATTTNAINTTARTVTVTLPTALSTTYTALTLASTSPANPLPVQLVAFTAVRQGEAGLLRWRTASELNSAYFEVQVSPDGSGWQVLSQVQAAGSSTVAHDYSYLDPALTRYNAPVLYYRLRQVDADGKAYFTSVATLSLDGPQWLATAYPNPFANELSVMLTTTEASAVTITVLDATGRLVLTSTQSASAGTQVYQLDKAGTITSGTYTLLVRQNGHTGTVRITRQ